MTTRFLQVFAASVLLCAAGAAGAASGVTGTDGAPRRPAASSR